MMGYEKKLVRSFSQADPQKLTYGLFIGCFIVLLTCLSISKISNRSSKLSCSALLHSDLMISDIISSSSPDQIVAGHENSRLDSNASDTNISSTSLDLYQSNDGIQKNSTSAVSMLDPPQAQGNDVSNIQAFDGRKDEIMVMKAEEWKPMCDYSNRRSDVCELDGDVRILIKNPMLIFVVKLKRNESLIRIRPYARKFDPSGMKNVSEIILKSSEINEAPKCTHNHSVPVIIFSVSGYTGNYFHDFSDVLLPLFQTCKHFNGEVQFFISDFKSWWINKYLPIFTSLSHYEIIKFNESTNESVHCFPQTFVGLQSHSDLNIDPSMSKNGHSMVDFTQFLRRTYFLPRDAPITVHELGLKKPRLLVIARSHTRRFVNLMKVVRMAEKLGFEVVVTEAEENVAEFARVVNSCDVMMGVHGAGLTNLLFLPTNAIVIQIVPWGNLDWISRDYFMEPAISMKLRYLEYNIMEEESTLMEIYGRDDPVLRDPYSIHKFGWAAIKEIYLEKQNVKLNVKRFRDVLVKALKLLQQK